MALPPTARLVEHSLCPSSQHLPLPPPRKAIPTIVLVAQHDYTNADWRTSAGVAQAESLEPKFGYLLLCADSVQDGKKVENAETLLMTTPGALLPFGDVTQHNAHRSGSLVSRSSSVGSAAATSSGDEERAPKQSTKEVASTCVG